MKTVAPHRRDGGGSTSSANDIHTMIDYYTAWNDHDLEKLTALIGERISFEGPEWVYDLRTSPFMTHAEVLLGAFADLRFEVESLDRYDHNLAVGKWILHGTNSGPIFGAASTGRTLCLRGADFFSFDCGRISSLQCYLDSLAVARQLGLQFAITNPRARRYNPSGTVRWPYSFAKAFQGVAL